MVERRRAWHSIIAFRQHTWSKNVRRDIPSPPLDSTHGRMTSSVACHHHLWAAHTVERRQLWHASIALWQHTQSKEIGRGMTSPPLDSTHGRTTSGVTCHHILWTAHTVGRRRAWHSIVALGMQTSRTTSGVECHHRLWAAHMVEQRRAWNAVMALGHHTRSNEVRRGMPS